VFFCKEWAAGSVIIWKAIFDSKNVPRLFGLPETLWRYLDIIAFRNPLFFLFPNLLLNYA